MKTQIGTCIVVIAFLCFGCSAEAPSSGNSREERDAKSRAEAARKEMETAPKTFQNRDVFKKNEPKPPAEKSGASESPK